MSETKTSINVRVRQVRMIRSSRCFWHALCVGHTDSFDDSVLTQRNASCVKGDDEFALRTDRVSVNREFYRAREPTPIANLTFPRFSYSELKRSLSWALEYG